MHWIKHSRICKVVPSYAIWACGCLLFRILNNRLDVKTIGWQWPVRLHQGRVLPSLRPFPAGGGLPARKSAQNQSSVRLLGLWSAIKAVVPSRGSTFSLQVSWTPATKAWSCHLFWQWRRQISRERERERWPSKPIWPWVYGQSGTGEHFSLIQCGQPTGPLRKVPIGLIVHIRRNDEINQSLLQGLSKKLDSGKTSQGTLWNGCVNTGRCVNHWNRGNEPLESGNQALRSLHKHYRSHLPDFRSVWRVAYPGFAWRTKEIFTMRVAGMYCNRKGIAGWSSSCGRRPLPSSMTLVGFIVWQASAGWTHGPDPDDGSGEANLP